MDLSQNEITVLKHIRSHSEHEKLSENEIRIDDLGKREISSSISWLQKKGLLSVETASYDRINIGKEGKQYLSEGLPEYRLLVLLADEGGISLEQVFKKLGKDKGSIAIVQFSKLGAKPRAGKLDLTGIKDIREKIEERQKALVLLEKGSSEISKDIMDNFRSRGEILEIKRTGIRIVSLTKEGKSMEIRETAGPQIEEIDGEVISSGIWKTNSFRSYDLSSPVEPFRGASIHPVTFLIDTVRRIFLELGFSEIKGHYVEYAGWNMDALFIPQHHPARDMQDTFYVETEQTVEFENKEVLDKLKKTHERGYADYPGWRYKWSEQEALRPLLRTHTTVNTIRYLYNHKTQPVAVFSIEKAFRHESVDWKHLAEIHQIEGVYYGKSANISSLKWLIREFYSKLGFNEIKLIPSYYPYTEPSMDVIAIIDGKEVEMGGSGLFRPEVTKPLGLKEPVIAWGLGLERLAMLFYGITDIRDIYNSDLQWLQSYKLRN